MGHLLGTAIMNSCLIEKLNNGNYRISREFSSKAAALAAMEKVLSVVEEAFMPVAQEVPLPPAAEVRITAAENEE
jgi:hypothetical protein